MGERVNCFIFDYIYCLKEVDSGTKFYIGRTIDPKRRIGEHRLGSRNYKDGDEQKYLYASTLDKLGVKWDMEVLMECGPDTEFYEDYFVNLYRHEPLQNMRAGDSEPWMGRDYSSPAAFVQARSAALARQKASTARFKRKKVHDYTKDSTTRFVDDLKRETESPALRAIRERRLLR